MRHIVLLQSLAVVPSQAAEAVAALPPAAYDWLPAAGQWSARHILAHLAAAEPLFLHRLTRIRDEESPFLPYFGPDDAPPASDEPLPRLMDRISAARGRLLGFLSSLPPEAWDRPAVHETLGATTLAQQVQNLIHHDGEHLGQLQALSQAWKARPDA
jgi:uncharacterized damage-inducible protein DinB